MGQELVILVASLLAILAGAELFTNALEHIGEQLGVSEGVTGSLFAAAGTALPETLVPVIAVFGSRHAAGEEVGVGAILGAPLMLSTLTFGLMGAFAWHRRARSGVLQPERGGLRRDLRWFVGLYGLSASALFIPAELRILRVGVSVVLVCGYFVYLLQTLRASAALVEQGHGTRAEERLHAGRAGLGPERLWMWPQLLAGLACIVFGTHGFVLSVEALAKLLRVPVLVLSLLVVPVATELPEKINSLLWLRDCRDTLAFGNVTGALVLQGSLLPALGLLLTPWRPVPAVLLAMALTLAASAWLLWRAGRGPLRAWHLLINAVCYAVYLGAIVN